jgi:hypothetical protein
VSRWLETEPPAQAGSSLVDFSPLKMEAIRSPKRRFTHLHGATSQKTAFFTQHSVRTYMKLHFGKRIHFWSEIMPTGYD